MKRILAMALVLLMIMSIPMSVFAANSIKDLADAGYTIISDYQSTLAPGVKMNEVVMYDKNGDRVEMYVTTSDPSVDTVHFYANYKDNQCAQWGMQTLSEQVAAMEANYDEPFKVVAGLNASYYNVTSGAPTGAFVMEGVDVSTNGDGYSFFAEMKDGTVMIGSKGEYSQYKGQIKEAIGGYIHLVKDGEICSGLDKVTKYPRQTIGITADGQVITMTADGSQAPQTVGLTIYEQAEVMLKLGCVEALHLDGGNSATFGAVREGSDDFETVNSPSGQAERAVSNTLMIVSTAVADGAFDHAVISSDYDYYLPNTSGTFSAIGVDATNAPANSIPETVEWALSDDSFGTIKDGKFTSTGKVGEVDIQMVDNGKVVGSKTISVVHPESISFGADEKTVPYGKTASMKVTAMYNNNEAYCIAENFDWTIQAASAGKLDGFDFTATTDESVASAVVTATYKYDEKVGSTSVNVKFGKGSEVLFDFEDGDISDWRGTDTINEWIDAQNAANGTTINKPESYSNNIGTQSSSVFLASKENGGHIKSGDYSLGFHMNHLNVDEVGSWVYNYLYYTGETKVLRDVANGKTAIRLGMWVYSPDITNIAFRLVRGADENGKLSYKYSYMTSDYDGVKTSYATNYKIPEAGWIYVYYDLTDLTDNNVQTTSVYIPQHDNKFVYPAFLQLFSGSATDTMNDIIYYIDDITLDYSDVTEDRDAPVISDASVCSDTANFTALNGQTVDNNLLSFSAKVTDDSGNSNATGINYSTAKIYVDGIDMSANAGFKATAGTMSLNNVYLIDGEHSVAFVVCDNQGNETRITKTLTVKGTANNPKVYIAGHNDSNATPEAGSVYYVDIKTSDISKIDEISTTLKLNTANTFEYENIICADGVEVTYDYDKLDYELTLNITNNGDLSGEATIASIPVRVWSWDEEETGITADAQFKSGAIPVIDIECKTTKGEITYVGTDYKNYVAGFYGDMDVATKLDNKSAWHKHTPVAMADKEATCTEGGYTDRTYCDGCASVVDWGTTIDVVGHDYKVVDGKLVCDICKEASNVNELVKVGDKYYYFIAGTTVSGWQLIDGNWHYFDPETKAAVSGEKEIGVITYQFEENGKLVSGKWERTLFGTRYYYGPDYHKEGWQTIDGKNYFFNGGYRIENGWQLVLESQQYRNWYYFDENGVCEDKTLKPADGFYTDRNGYAYAKDGVGLSGVHLIDGKYYAFGHQGYARTNGTYAGRLFKDGYTAYTGLLDVNGTVCYYENGRPRMAGLIEIDGDYYFAGGANGEITIDKTTYAWATSCDLPMATYTFDKDGKMVDGIVEKDGKLYYYENGKAKMAGLIEIDGDYYFAGGADGEITVDKKQYVWKDNGIKLENNECEFGRDGKMLNGVVEKDGTLYYYEMGRPKMAGLVEVDGDYYFAGGANGEITVNKKQYVWKDNGIKLENNECEFGLDGKMLDGIVEKDGTLYYYVMGRPKMAGLIEIDGDYYFAGGANGEITVDRVQYIWKDNGIELNNYTCEFGVDGKMLNGIVEKNGSLYYYEMGSPTMAGLVEVDGDYYFAKGADGKVATGTTYVWKSNGILPEDTYHFGEDGKMLDGFVTKDDGIYYYENGKYGKLGLNYIDGYYYFIEYAGKVVTNGRHYVWETNGYSIKMNYTFDELGRVVG